jgi:hypothetical protein
MVSNSLGRSNSVNYIYIVTTIQVKGVSGETVTGKTDIRLSYIYIDIFIYIYISVFSRADTL